MKDEIVTRKTAFASHTSNINPQVMGQIKAEKSLWQYILSDLDRYRITDHRSYLGALIICPGATAGIIYRISHWMFVYQGRFQNLVRIGYLFSILIKRLSEALNGISIQPQATIGEGLYIGHGGSVHIGGKAVLGNNCNISQEVTIGVAGRGDRRGTPRIGDRVFIGAGAKILGAIEIGNDVAIGANSVVTKSLPDRAVAVGIPANIISYEGSFEFVTYHHMDDDLSLQQSLRLREEYHHVSL
jgi:serine O-acetyltransferase